MRRRRFLGALAGTAVAAGAGCISVEAVEESSTQRFEVADEAVTVTNPDGDVTVRSGDRDDVRLRSLKFDGTGNEDALSNVEVTTSREDGTLAIDVVDDTGDGAVDATGVDLDVTVPENTPVPALTVGDGEVDLRGTSDASTVEAGDGQVTVRDVGGDLTVEAGDGEVDVRTVGGSVDVDADDGTVDLRAVDGSVSVDADDGDVVAREITGDVTATLEDGSATVEEVGGTVSVDAADGDVTVARPGAVGDCSLGDGSATIDVPAVEGDATLATDDGNLDVALARTLDVQLTAITTDGTVTVRDFDVATGDETDSVEATLGDGARSLTLRSGDGDVTITAME